MKGRDREDELEAVLARAEPRGGVRPVAKREPPRELVSRVADLVEEKLDRRRTANNLKQMAMSFHAPGAAGATAAEAETASGKDRAVLHRAVPYLVYGVKQEQEPKLQQRCAYALSQMGPDACYAVPELATTLESSRNPGQQRAVIRVLRNLGPAARPAAPALEKVALNGPAELRAEARDAYRCVCEAPAAEDDVARLLARPLTDPERKVVRAMSAKGKKAADIVRVLRKKSDK
jgi:hypothetical protein